MLSDPIRSSGEAKGAVVPGRAHLSQALHAPEPVAKGRAVGRAREGRLCVTLAWGPSASPVGPTLGRCAGAR